MEHRGFEPLASSMPWKRATNCANAPKASLRYPMDPSSGKRHCVTTRYAWRGGTSIANQSA